MNSPHPLLLQTGRQSAPGPVILTILRAGTIRKCQVRAQGGGNVLQRPGATVHTSLGDGGQMLQVVPPAFGVDCSV